MKVCDARCLYVSSSVPLLLCVGAEVHWLILDTPFTTLPSDHPLQHSSLTPYIASLFAVIGGASQAPGAGAIAAAPVVDAAGARGEKYGAYYGEQAPGEEGASGHQLKMKAASEGM